MKRFSSLRKPLNPRDNKYTRGVVAVIAGSRQYPGAAILTVGGARRGGAGYVKFLSNEDRISDLVISQFPDVVPLSSLNRERYDALVVGPGGASIKRIPELIPVVLDSAALRLALKPRDGITIVTPHEGELKYLRYSTIPSHHSSDVIARKEVAEALAKRLGVIVVLKGNQTVIASPANSTVMDKFGGPELATAGSGDILAGLLGSMLATWRPVDSHSAHDVTCHAVELHSRAGRYAAKHFSSVTALEILDSLAHI